MPNGHGGRRAGAGRKSAKHEFVDDGQVTPIQFLLGMMRDEKQGSKARFEAARAAIPYCSARLQNIVVEADVVIEALNWDN